MSVCVIAHANGGSRFLKLLGPVTPVLDALVTPRGYTVAAQVAPRRRVWECLGDVARPRPTRSRTLVRLLQFA